MVKNKGNAAIVLAALGVLAGSAIAGPHDYYECTGADGITAWSATPCAKGERQRRIADSSPPQSTALGGRAGGTIKLSSGRNNHFYTTVNINGKPVRAVIDTGASLVSLSASTARRLGIDASKGVAAQSYTANGVASVTRVNLASVELGGNVVRNVAGSLMAQDLGPDIEALLGMSFLKHFEVSTDGAAMTLRPK